jgi:glutamyl-tRNA reductase
MELLCLGLNHKTAPVEVRERFAVGAPKLGEAAREIIAATGVRESVVISTCNRTEFYLAAPHASDAFSRLESHLASKTPPHQSAAPHFYRMEKSAAAQHLCRVGSGLDSMMLGETEIFGQVKQAYQAALDAEATSTVLNKVFQRAFGIGKKVRTETSIQEGSTSVGNVAVDLAEKIFGHLKDSEVMILGAGEMSRITAQSLVSRGARSIFVSNRSFDRAEQLASEMGGTALRFDDWQNALNRVDIVISSTGAPHAIGIGEQRVGRRTAADAQGLGTIVERVVVGVRIAGIGAEHVSLPSGEAIRFEIDQWVEGGSRWWSGVGEFVGVGEAVRVGVRRSERDGGSGFHDSWLRRCG